MKHYQARQPTQPSPKAQAFVCCTAHIAYDSTTQKLQPISYDLSSHESHGNCLDSVPGHPRGEARHTHSLTQLATQWSLAMSYPLRLQLPKLRNWR